MKLIVLLFAILSYFLFTACEDFNGGSVEIAWVIRGTDHHSYGCNSSVMAPWKIHSIRLTIMGTEDPYIDVDICESGLVGDCVYRCDNESGSTQRGVTTFSIPEGVWHIGIVALDPDGTEIPHYVLQVPEPIRTYVKPGELTFLGVWQLVINL